MPTMSQAGVYSAVTHYLNAIAAAKTDEALPVVAKMKQTPINDMFATGGKIRDDGRMVHDMYLVQVKAPGEVEAAVGLLQGAAHREGRRCLPSAERERLSAGEEIADCVTPSHEPAS